MKKVCEINGITLFINSKHIIQRPTRVSRVNDQWLTAAFTPSQLKFLRDCNAVLRPHPRHNPTIELFVDESTLDDRDWTMLHLLF